MCPYFRPVKTPPLARAARRTKRSAPRERPPARLRMSGRRTMWRGLTRSGGRPSRMRRRRDERTSIPAFCLEERKWSNQRHVYSESISKKSLAFYTWKIIEVLKLFLRFHVKVFSKCKSNYLQKKQLSNICKSCTCSYGR